MSNREEGSYELRYLEAVEKIKELKKTIRKKNEELRHLRQEYVGMLNRDREDTSVPS